MPDGFPPFLTAVRQPPMNVKAEMALLGALLRSNKVLERCGSLEPEHFVGQNLGAVFRVVREDIAAGRVVDGVSLTQRFDAELVGDLLASMVAIEPAAEYARIIRQCAQDRELLALAQQIVDGVYGGVPPAENWAQACALGDRATQGQQIDALTTFDAAMDAALSAMWKAQETGPAGISTGFRALDERLGGLEPGLVYVIAGRPGMGKSALGHIIAINAARNGVGVLELSLEMSATQLGQRALSSAAGVPLMAVKRGRVSVGDADSIMRARKELAGLPLTIDDAGGQTPAMIAAKARAAHRRHGLGLLMIDHLHLMRAEADDARHGGTWAVGRASNTVLKIAKDCGCPVLLLAQLSRGVEGREDKRPTLADLRQAGDIEQDAYAVGFVYRPEYYLGSEPEQRADEGAPKFAERVDNWRERKAQMAGKAEVVWAKVRDGEPGSDRLRFDGQTATFSEAD